MESKLASRGVVVVHPGLCLDGPPFSSHGLPTINPCPDIVHIHWPEKLVAWYGVKRALSVLESLVRSGAKIVQTIHNLYPHESNAKLRGFIYGVDALSRGAHFFSEEHEKIAKIMRPHLPRRRLIFLHPAFPSLARRGRILRKVAGRELVLGCLGRIRSYKRTLEFAQAFEAVARPGFRLLIAGAADSRKTDLALLSQAQRSPQITYVPGFATENKFVELLNQVDWIALPYKYIFSSGVLVTAIQARRQVLAPMLLGVDAYNIRSILEVIDPWDDTVAIRRWMEMATDKFPGYWPSLPSWEEVIDQLICFYKDIQ